MSRPLQLAYPWVTSPFIANAPMGGMAGGELAGAVTKAGGFGFIGSVFDMDALASHLEKASSMLEAESGDPSETLPIGIGFLLIAVNLEQVLPILKKYRPAAIWLFAAPTESDYVSWTSGIREAFTNPPDIWIQTGSVASALSLARKCNPSVLVLQGSDAGGHGFERGAGIISLVPETLSSLAQNGFGHIPVIAAGGIADGRGVAAALALGAQGVVMGTAFLAAKEVMLHPGYQAAVIRAVDGGQSTVRAKVFDELKGPNIWPIDYDGRSLATKTYDDYVQGMGIEENSRLFAEAAGREDGGFGVGGRTTVWAGSGVGLVKEVRSARDIVEGVRADARDVICSLL